MAEEMRLVFDNETGGIKGETFCALMQKNLDKNYFPKQAGELVDTCTDFVEEDMKKAEAIKNNMDKESVVIPRIKQIEYVAKYGITPEQLRNFFTNHLDEMTPQKVKFVVTSLVRTKRFEMQQELSKGKQNVYVKR